MKLVIEEVDNGFIIEESPEVMVGGIPVVGKKHVFDDVAETVAFIADFYSKRPRKTKPKKKPEET